MLPILSGKSKLTQNVMNRGGPGAEHEALDELRSNVQFQPRKTARITGGSLPSGKISSILDRMEKRVDDIKVPGPYSHMGFDTTVASSSRAGVPFNSSVTGLGSPVARGQTKARVHFGCTLIAVTESDIVAALSPFGEAVNCRIDERTKVRKPFSFCYRS